MRLQKTTAVIGDKASAQCR